MLTSPSLKRPTWILATGKVRSRAIRWANPGLAFPEKIAMLGETSSDSAFTACSLFHMLVWLGWQDSNLRFTGSKPDALPLGYAPNNQ